MSEPYFLKLTSVNGNPLLVNVAQIVGIRADDGNKSTTLIFSVDGEQPFEVAETMDDLLEMLPSAWVSRWRHVRTGAGRVSAPGSTKEQAR